MKRWQRGLRREKGFTLVELVVVMTIIAILAGAIALQISNRVQDAKRARAKHDIENMKTALELYKADNGDYPTTQQGLAALVQKPSSPPLPANWDSRYIDKVGMDPWGGEYIYRCPGQDNPDGFDLICYGKDGNPGGEGNDADMSNLD